MGAAASVPIQQIQDLLDATTPRMTEFIPHAPHPRQAAFLLLDCEEALYGGAAGGGKSDALLMAALQYVDLPNYSAILFRRSYADLALPGALMDRAYEWLNNTGARWKDTEKRWIFPSGASLSFGYLETDRDKFRYQSAEFQFVGFDELTQFQDTQYLYLFSRLRRLANSPVPIRMRAASNPGGVGHVWVKDRFIVSKSASRRFVRAGLRDNPFVDQESYLSQLGKLDAVTKAQLRDGDWNATSEGSLFPRKWLVPLLTNDWPVNTPTVARRWDFAATALKKSDFTAGGKIAIHNNHVYIVDVKRLKGIGAQVEDLVRKTAFEDGWRVPIILEIERGSAGKLLHDHYVRHILQGFVVIGDLASGDKITRMQALSAQCEHQNVSTLRGKWNEALFDEGDLITKEGDYPHDDQWDTLAGCYNWLTQIKYRGSNPTPIKRPYSIYAR